MKRLKEYPSLWQLLKIFPSQFAGNKMKGQLISMVILTESLYSSWRMNLDPGGCWLSPVTMQAATTPRAGYPLKKAYFHSCWSFFLCILQKVQRLWVSHLVSSILWRSIQKCVELHLKKDVLLWEHLASPKLSSWDGLFFSPNLLWEKVTWKRLLNWRWFSFFQ